METKPFWSSKTLWVNAVALAAAALGAFNIDVLTPEVQAQVVGVVMAVVNIALRFVTNSGISVK